MGNGIFRSEHPDMSSADIGDNRNVRFQDCSKLLNFSFPVHTELKDSYFIFFCHGKDRERQACFGIEISFIFYRAVSLSKDGGKQFFCRRFTV